MAIFRRKKEAPEVAAAKEKGGDEMMALFAIVILIIIAVVVASLRFLGVDPYEDSTDDYTLQELFELYGYDEDGIQERLRPHLDIEAVYSESEPFAARDGELRYAYISKPEGPEPFAAVVLLHGSPAGERVTERFSQEVAERLAQDAGVFTIAVDWRDSDFGDGDLIDAVSVLNAVEKYTVDIVNDERKPILYVGVDHGAYLALLSAAEEPELVSGVASIAGYWDLQAQYQFLSESDPTAAANFLRDSGCDAAIDPSNCLEQRSITQESIRELKSVMLIHHQDDPLVSVDQSRLISSMRTTSQLSIQETALHLLTADSTEDQAQLSNSAHNLLEDSTSAEFEETYALLLDWVKEQSQPRLQLIDPDEETPSTTTTPSTPPTDPQEITDPLEINL